MPDHRVHRGAHPEDARLFAPERWPALQAAAADIAWLLDRGYALRSSLALVGNRHALSARQRLAVARCTCSQEQLARREAHRLPASALVDRELWIDGYNVLISIESALAGGIILAGRDGCYRDMASLHGTYRDVAETVKAARLIGDFAADCGVAKGHWLLDRPMANSGRLKDILLSVAQQCGWTWQVDLEYSPDKILSTTLDVVASSDSAVLDRCNCWTNAARSIIEQKIPDVPVVALYPAKSL